MVRPGVSGRTSLSVRRRFGGCAGQIRQHAGAGVGGQDDARVALPHPATAVNRGNDVDAPGQPGMPACTLVARASTSARLILQAKRSSQPAGTG